jgi:hypothetical protein
MPRLAPKGRLKAVLKLRKHGMTYVGIAEKAKHYAGQC